MLNFMKEKANALNEFMLDENEREVLTKVGKYSIYDINEEVEQILTEFTKMMFEDKNADRARQITESDEFMVKILGLMTDLPKEILTIENYSKIKSRQKKIFRDICFEVSNIIHNYTLLLAKKWKNINDDMELMNDKEKERYLKSISKRKND